MTGLYLAMYGNDVSLSQAGFISIFAMVVVFVVLLIISYMIDIVAFFLKGSNSPKKVSAAVSNEGHAAAKKNANSDTDVAIIAAAVASYLGTSVDNIRIQQIRRVSNNESVWSERGLFAQINN